MIFSTRIILDANGSESNLVSQRLKVSLGLVYKVELFFPAGCAGKARVVIKDGNYQVWPTTPNDYFRGSNQLLQYDDLYFKNIEPSEFQVVGFNDDTVYAHSVIVRIGLVSEEQFKARFLPNYNIKEQIDYLEKLKEEQERIRQETLSNPFPFLE